MFFLFLILYLSTSLRTRWMISVVDRSDMIHRNEMNTLLCIPPPRYNTMFTSPLLHRTNQFLPHRLSSVPLNLQLYHQKFIKIFTHNKTQLTHFHTILCNRETFSHFFKSNSFLFLHTFLSIKLIDRVCCYLFDFFDINEVFEVPLLFNGLTRFIFGKLIYNLGVLERHKGLGGLR